MTFIVRLVAFLLALLPSLEEASAGDRNRHWSSVGFTLENTAWVDADPQAVWRAFVEDADKWWPDELGWGGDPTAWAPQAAAGATHDDPRRMIILAVEPGRCIRLADDLGALPGAVPHGSMEWRFAEENGGTRITLRYGADGTLPDDLSELAAVVDEVQAERLHGLARYLSPEAGGDLGESA